MAVSQQPADNDDEDERQRSRRHSKVPHGTKNPNPTQLQFYPSQWKDVLENGKDRYTRLIFLELGFTSKQEDQRFALDCLTEAIYSHEEAGNGVEEGIRFQLNHFMVTHLLL
jgi:hypothetical protein